MDLDESQRAAISAGVRGLDVDVRGTTTKINGPAGTGKTTIIREVLASGVSENVLVLAPTNKAARVLQSKGIPAQTIHSALYVPAATALREARKACLTALEAPDLSADERGKLEAKLREIEFDLTVTPRGERLTFGLRSPNEATDRPVMVDEASMVGGQLYRDLRESTDRGIVLVGDDAQLPPVRDDAVFHSFAAAATLETIHRQSAGSPILEIATLIRADRVGDAVDLARSAGLLRPMHEAPLRADVQREIEICWRNATRRERNAWHRAGQGRQHWLERGDWLISLRNRDPEANGSICRVLPARSHDWKRINIGSRSDPEHVKAPVVRLAYEDEELLRPIAISDPGEGPQRVEARSGWDYAYSLTAHKSQGSEWESVTVYDEWSWADGDPGRAEDRRRWLYTAITRAREELIWCQ